MLLSLAVAHLADALSLAPFFLSKSMSPPPSFLSPPLCERRRCIGSHLELLGGGDGHNFLGSLFTEAPVCLPAQGLLATGHGC